MTTTDPPPDNMEEDRLEETRRLGYLLGALLGQLRRARDERARARVAAAASEMLEELRSCLAPADGDEFATLVGPGPVSAERFDEVDVALVAYLTRLIAEVSPTS